jgi:hypothetical protein
MYADETGDLELTGAPGASDYFGFGTALYRGDHGEALWQGLQLRAALEARGVRLPQGLHAKNDSFATRQEMFSLIAQQAPRFDATYLYKSNANPKLRKNGEMYLYQLAWFLHFNQTLPQVSLPGDTIYVIAASLGSGKKQSGARKALEEACRQGARGRHVVLCVWEARSAWGVQVADYALWAGQRIIEGRPCAWFETCIQPSLILNWKPWGLRA